MKKLLFILLVCLCFAVRGQTNGYSVNVNAGLNNTNPLDGTTYYGGIITNSGSTVDGSVSFKTFQNGTINVVYIVWACSGTVGSNENISVYLRKNATTDYLIQTVGNTNAVKTFTNTSLGVSFSSGDEFQIKLVCPTWATNPTACFSQGYILVSPTP